MLKEFNTSNICIDKNEYHVWQNYTVICVVFFSRQPRRRVVLHLCHSLQIEWSRNELVAQLESRDYQWCIEYTWRWREEKAQKKRRRRTENEKKSQHWFQSQLQTQKSHKHLRNRNQLQNYYASYVTYAIWLRLQA